MLQFAAGIEQTFLGKLYFRSKEALSTVQNPNEASSSMSAIRILRQRHHLVGPAISITTEPSEIEVSVDSP
jgi:hypothetical protein